MARLKGVVSLIAITGAVMLALRLLHVALPIVYPASNPGPFTPACAEEVAGYTGFAPYVPFYRPAILGRGLPQITVTRVEVPQVTLAWSGEKMLEIVERPSVQLPRLPAAAAAIPEIEGAYWWPETRVTRAALLRAGIAIEIRSDLPLEELHRVIVSLRAR